MFPYVVDYFGLAAATVLSSVGRVLSLRRCLLWVVVIFQ